MPFQVKLMPLWSVPLPSVRISFALGVEPDDVRCVDTGFLELALDVAAETVIHEGCHHRAPHAESICRALRHVGFAAAVPDTGVAGAGGGDIARSKRIMTSPSDTRSYVVSATGLNVNVLAMRTSSL